jgi:hypothetical protein
MQQFSSRSSNVEIAVPGVYTSDVDIAVFAVGGERDVVDQVAEDVGSVAFVV